VTKYILVFLAGFITAVYCLAPSVDQTCQATQQAGSIRPAATKAVVWAIRGVVGIATDLAGRFWRLVEGKLSRPSKDTSPADPAPTAPGAGASRL